MSSKSSSDGVGFLGLLCLLFIGLKLGSVIDWSWWWVLSPIWIPFAAFLGIALIAFVAMGILALLDGYRKRRK